MHLCAACSKLMNDEFEERRITAGRSNVTLAIQRFLKNPLCDECLANGYHMSQDNEWVMIPPINASYETPVALSDYLMGGENA